MFPQGPGVHRAPAPSIPLTRTEVALPKAEGCWGGSFWARDAVGGAGAGCGTGWAGAVAGRWGRPCRCTGEALGSSGWLRGGGQQAGDSSRMGSSGGWNREQQPLAGRM